MQIFLWVSLSKSLYFYFWQTQAIFISVFIDDIFLIWNGTKKKEEKSECHPSINLNMKCLKQINFVHATVFKVDRKVDVKPTDRQSYLHSKSEHPNSTKKSIAYSQALRFNKICYSRSDLHNNCKRGYNPAYLTR